MNQFAQDVDEGLSASPKYLSSKYFYDKKGDALFQEIMKLDEYYLTRCEFEILNSNKDQILHSITVDPEEKFNLIEFGAGDGFKTKILLNHFLQSGQAFKYYPIDISSNVLDILTSDLRNQFPDLDIEGLQEEYFSALSRLSEKAERRLVLFLGSNIGNFGHQKAVDFLGDMRTRLSEGDHLLIGLDLKKHPDIIRAAYNDSKGVTALFNMNVLDRINNELGGNFDLKCFEHNPTYDIEQGASKSYIRSKEPQSVFIEEIGKSFEFETDELIFTEISQKYSIEEIENFARESGFEVVQHFKDSKGWFVDSLWKV